MSYVGYFREVYYNIYNNCIIIQDGCKEKLVVFVKEKLYVVGGVGVGLACVQLIGLLLAWCMTKAIKWEYEVM